MNETMSTLLLLGAELGVILIVTFVGLVVFYIRRRRNDKRYVASFIDEHKNSREERREAVKESIKSCLPLVDDDMEEFLDKISSSERKLYKNVLNMYLGFERQCLADIRDELSATNDNWVSVIEKSVQQAVDEHIQNAALANNSNESELENEIVSLKEDKNKLAAELAEAMETMEDIVKEYSLMYAGQENTKMDKLSDDYNKLKSKSDAHSKEDA